jgi:hypothetical protein
MGDGAAFGRTRWRASYRVELPLAGQAERSKGENANNAAKADTYSKTQFYRARCNIIGGRFCRGTVDGSPRLVRPNKAERTETPARHPWPRPLTAAARPGANITTSSKPFNCLWPRRAARFRPKGTTMTKFSPPPSPEAAIAELEEIERQADRNSDEIVASVLAEIEPKVEMISIGELLLLSIETRIGRIADACEAANKIKTAGRNDIVGLTAQVERLANAFEAMAGFVGCLTESVEGQDGVARCYLRTRDDNHGWFLSERDERED